jgi:hypothetical protein
MSGRKIRLRKLSAIFLPGIFLLPPIFERILLHLLWGANQQVQRERWIQSLAIRQTRVSSRRFNRAASREYS